MSLFPEIPSARQGESGEISHIVKMSGYKVELQSGEIVHLNSIIPKKDKDEKKPGDKK